MKKFLTGIKNKAQLDDYLFALEDDYGLTDFTQPGNWNTQDPWDALPQEYGDQGGSNPSNPSTPPDPSTWTSVDPWDALPQEYGDQGGSNPSNPSTPPDPSTWTSVDPWDAQSQENQGGGSDGGSGKPIILDLDGDGVELVDLDESTAFYDIDGDGYRERMGWASADDGFLAYDKDGDGVIAAHDELSFVSYVEGARTDLEGLAHFDTNGNGQLDPGDAEWGKFRVWQDLDQDGESDPGELRTLSEAGIESIALTSDGVERTVANNEVFGEGVYTHADGERSFLDAALRHSAYGFREDANGDITVRIDGEAALHVAGPTADAVRSLDAAALGVAGIVGHDTVDHLTAAPEGSLLSGAGGDDVLTGGEGDDWLDGGEGADTLRGGALCKRVGGHPRAAGRPLFREARVPGDGRELCLGTVNGLSGWRWLAGTKCPWRCLPAPTSTALRGCVLDYSDAPTLSVSRLLRSGRTGRN